MLPSMAVATRPGGSMALRGACPPQAGRFTRPAAAAHGSRAAAAAAVPSGADAPGTSTSAHAVPEEVDAQSSSVTPDLAASVTAAACLLLASAGPAWADAVDAASAAGTDFSKGGFAKESYYVTLGLFLLSLPGA